MVRWKAKDQTKRKAKKLYESGGEESLLQYQQAGVNLSFFHTIIINHNKKNI